LVTLDTGRTPPGLHPATRQTATNQPATPDGNARQGRTMRSTGPAGSTPNPVRLYDVARLAGGSTATVSRVVHGQDRVRESTRLRVTQVIEELGYVPDGAAQSLSRRSKNVIGLVCVEREVDHIDIENVGLLYY